MMLQYEKIKAEHRDSILFFRLGDFYEMFKSDAKEACRILNLTLTKRNGITMCGIPYHAASNYIAKLIAHGKKVAICEQTELPKAGKGIAKREVVEIHTPGSLVEESFLDSERNNYLCALCKVGEEIVFAAYDISTAYLIVQKIPVESSLQHIRKELYRLECKELVIQESFYQENPELYRYLHDQSNILLNQYPDWYFDRTTGYEMLLRSLGVQNLKAFTLNSMSPELSAVSAVLQYAEDTKKGSRIIISEFKPIVDRDYVFLDESSQKNLELLKNLWDSSSKYTLFELLNETSTSMGTRMLRKWITRPLMNLVEITYRQNQVETFYRHQLVMGKFKDFLKNILDLERLTSRIVMEKAHAKDLISLGKSITYGLEALSYCHEQNLLQDIIFDDEMILKETATLILDSIDEEPSILLSEGKIIRSGYDSEIDHLKELAYSSKKILDEYLESEKETSGIQNLKIKYNKIIGYFLEVSKGNISLVPEHFIRRQSLVGSERYTTIKLGELEENLQNAQEKLVSKERDLFLKIRADVASHAKSILHMAKKIAELDCFASLATCATINGYIKPILSESEQIKIVGGRHPVVEKHLNQGSFVPNNIELNSKKGRFALITGPNMAGKSTYLRQTALIVLLAQIGSFVPADRAEIGLVDSIFCRVGASDNLARGESTFLVEMNEAALILNNATHKSLIIMDEVGRGTSTFDGLSLAWSISEYIIEVLASHCLFATHYHELTGIMDDRMQNLSLSVDDERDQIVFLKQVVEGPSNNSYGIHVAKLAGIPESVLIRAGDLLEYFTGHNIQNDGKQKLPEKDFFSPRKQQNDLFSTEDQIKQKLVNIDINNTTPMNALVFLNELKSLL